MGKASQVEFRFFKGAGATEKKIIMRGTESGDTFAFIPMTIDLSKGGVSKNEQELYFPFKAGASVKQADLVAFATAQAYNLDRVDESANLIDHTYTS